MKLLTNILLTGACALLLSACSAGSDSGDDLTPPNVSNNYINLAITVSSGSNAATRGVPTGGEDGDGREAGFDHENAITGITLLLYQDAAGINTAGNPTIDFVAFYPVTKTTKGADPIEATYETGNQLVPHNSIDFTKTYHAIVVANADLRSSVTAGSTTLNDIRNLTLSTIYNGSEQKPADQCGNFVMSSEQDQTLAFSGAGITDAAGDYYYDMTTTPILIERMAARIDFWSAKSNGYKTSAENPAYTVPGYEYNVAGSTDKFVVTGIVPFNLTNLHSTYGEEYLIKQCRTDISDASTLSYLASEDTHEYVMDPKTTAKTGTETLNSSLERVYTLTGDGSKLENSSYNPYYHSVEAMHGSAARKDINDGVADRENVVVAYPMENTISTTSKLYYYATGIAIIGYYYVNGNGTGTRYVYLGYLRHVGESTNYDIQPYTTPLATTDEMGGTTPMNFGIVRNNIYRVSINSIDQKGSVELAIKVKKWDPFTHSFIYM